MVIQKFDPLGSHGVLPSMENNIGLTKTQRIVVVVFLLTMKHYPNDAARHNKETDTGSKFREKMTGLT